MRSQKDFLKIYKKINRRFYKKIFRRSSDNFWTFDKIFLKLKIKKKTRRSSVDLKKISDEDLSKISKRFELKIFQRSQKDFRKKLLEDLPKKINVDLLKIFRRKSFDQNLYKIFSSKNLLKKFSEDLPKNEFVWRFSFFGRSQKRFGSWEFP